MKRVELYARVRHAVMIDGLSQREAARCFGIDPRTVKKMLSYSVPPGYVRARPPARPKLDPFIGVIDRILEEDKERPRKQRHTSKRIFERLRDEYGFTGGITIVKDYICSVRHRQDPYRPWSACQKGLTVGFITAAALVHELMEARDEKRLLRFQKQLAKYKLLIIDELGFVPLSKTGAELLFEVFSQRYEQGSTLLTSNLPSDEWTEVFGSERLTGALLDRLTHHVHILEMNGDSYRLNQSRKRWKSPKTPA